MGQPVFKFTTKLFLLQNNKSIKLFLRVGCLINWKRGWLFETNLFTIYKLSEIEALLSEQIFTLKSPNNKYVPGNLSNNLIILK